MWLRLFHIEAQRKYSEESEDIVARTPVEAINSTELLQCGASCWGEALCSAELLATVEAFTGSHKN